VFSTTVGFPRRNNWDTILEGPFSTLSLEDLWKRKPIKKVRKGETGDLWETNFTFNFKPGIGPGTNYQNFWVKDWGIYFGINFGLEGSYLRGGILLTVWNFEGRLNHLKVNLFNRFGWKKGSSIWLPTTKFRETSLGACFKLIQNVLTGDCFPVGLEGKQGLRHWRFTIQT